MSTENFVTFLWYFYGMKTTIDGGGRLVIPKALRQRMGLQAGMEVELRFSEGILEIIPSSSKGQLVREDGLLVWDPGPDAPPLDVRSEIERFREEREKEILGE